jgi:hypothetical protein
LNADRAPQLKASVMPLPWLMVEDRITNPIEQTGKLFSVSQITLSTFLGTPIAGCLLVAANYRQLGKDAAALPTLGVGAASTILIFAIAFSLPENFPNAALPVAYCFGMRQLVSYFQGDAISNYLKAGGRKGSWIIPIAVGLGCLALIFAVVFGSILFLSD